MSVLIRNVVQSNHSKDAVKRADLTTKTKQVKTHLSKQLKCGSGIVSEDQPSVRDIEGDVQIQRITQEIVEKYEKRISEMRSSFQQELSNVVGSLQNQKPKRRKFSFSLFGKKPSKLFIVYNHNSPVYCFKKSCPTRRTGFNHGIECVTFDLEIAHKKIDEYWAKNNKNPAAFIKLVEIEIDDDVGEPSKSLEIPNELWKENKNLSELLYAVPGTEPKRTD